MSKPTLLLVVQREHAEEKAVNICAFKTTFWRQHLCTLIFSVMLRVLLTFIHSFIHSFIDSFIHIFTRSLLYLFIYLIIYLFGHATIGLRDLVHPYSQDCTLSLGSWSMAQLHISDRAIRAFFWWWCYFDYIWFCRPIIIFRGVLWCQRIILLICCKIYPADISKRRFIHVSVTYRKPRTCTSHYSHGLWLLNVMNGRFLS